jgi:hypothetical protein
MPNECRQAAMPKVPIDQSSFLASPLPPIIAKGVKNMKTLLSTIMALGLAAAIAAPAWAGDAPKTKEDCEKAGMKWDEASQSCAAG